MEDDPKSPQFIETAHRRGYRFIAPLAEGTSAAAGNKSVLVPAPTYEPSNPANTPAASGKILGRETALAQMQRCLDEALAGHIQVLFVTGEAGIGKTTLVEAFLDQVGSNICVLRGQCLEQYGSGEAYLPVLDAISRIGGQNHSQLIEILKR